MTRETFLEIFKGNENFNFSIYTNIAEGEGINGVSFNTFVGEVISRSDANLCYYRKINHIAKCCDNYVVIDVYECKTDKEREQNHTPLSKKTRFYLPYDAIVLIEICTKDCDEWGWGYPIKLTKKTNLK